MRFRFFFIFLFCSAAIVSALDGHWVLASSIAQTVLNDEVFYADDNEKPLISEINFRTDEVAEVLLQTAPDEKPVWHGAGYRQEGEYLFMEIVGFGKVRIFWQKKLKNRLLLSYLVYITDEGIKQPEPQSKEDKQSEDSAAGEDSETGYIDDSMDSGVLIQGEQPEQIIPPGIDSLYSGGQEEDSSADDDEQSVQPEDDRQLLVISSYFKPR